MGLVYCIGIVLAMYNVRVVIKKTKIILADTIDITYNAYFDSYVGIYVIDTYYDIIYTLYIKHKP